MSWRIRSLVAHGIGNALSNVGRSAALMIFAAAMCGSVFYTDMATAEEIRVEEQSRIDSGLHVLQASAESGLDAQNCERIGFNDGFIASGGIRNGPLVVMATDHATQIPTAQVTAGMLRLASPGRSISALDSPSGVILGEALQRQLSLSPGSRLILEGQPVTRVQSILDETERTSFIAGWVLSVTPAVGVVDECWIETEPDLENDAEFITRSIFENSDLELRPMIALDARSRDLAEEWRKRATLGLMRFGIVALIALGALLTFVRRAEYGLYRALGMQRRDVLLTTQAETAVIVAVGATLGVLWAAAWLVTTQGTDAGFAPSARTGVALRDSCAMAAAMLVVLPGSSLFARSSIMNALKDR